MDTGKKTKCQTKFCNKISQYDVSDGKFCIGCITENGRKHASHRRMEHQILSDITRGVRKSLPGWDLAMKYDEVYHDKQRPDLVISNTANKNIVMVEVDETQHFTVEHLKKDDMRFKKFYEESSSQNKSLSVVRVVPGEKSKNSMFKTEKTKLYRDDSGYIQKNPENYNKYIKESVNKIVRIICDKQSYLYKDQQISVGPTVEKNSVSPIFSDTSSPDISPSIPRARAIIATKNIEQENYKPKITKQIKIYGSETEKRFVIPIQTEDGYIFANQIKHTRTPSNFKSKLSTVKKETGDTKISETPSAKKPVSSPKEIPKKVSTSPKESVVLPELPKKVSTKKTSFFSFLSF
jgi:hypothetical protein